MFKEGGPLMMMKESLFLLISNVLGRGCDARDGAHSTDFKGRGCGAREGAHL